MLATMTTYEPYPARESQLGPILGSQGRLHGHLDAGVPVRRRGGSRRHEFRRAQPLAPTFLRYRRRQGALLLADAARTQPLARPTGADGVHPQRFLAVLPHRAERK